MCDVKDPKRDRWLKEHPGCPFKWDLAIKDVKQQTAGTGTGDPMVFEDPAGKDFGMIVDMLMMHGVAPTEANDFVCGVVRARTPITFHEFYGRGGLCSEASRLPHSLKVKGLRALDFRPPDRMVNVGTSPGSQIGSGPCDSWTRRTQNG